MWRKGIQWSTDTLFHILSYFKFVLLCTHSPLANNPHRIRKPGSWCWQFQLPAVVECPQWSCKDKVEADCWENKWHTPRLLVFFPLTWCYSFKSYLFPYQPFGEENQFWFWDLFTLPTPLSSDLQWLFFVVGYCWRLLKRRWLRDSRSSLKLTSVVQTIVWWRKGMVFWSFLIVSVWNFIMMEVTVIETLW